MASLGRDGSQPATFGLSAPRVLLPDLRGGGAERVSIELAYEFTRLGYKVEFVLMEAVGELYQEIASDFSIHDLGISRLRELPFSLVSHG